jgi:predicted transcriptional regulator
MKELKMKEEKINMILTQEDLQLMNNTLDDIFKDISLGKKWIKDLKSFLIEDDAILKFCRKYNKEKGNASKRLNNLLMYTYMMEEKVNKEFYKSIRKKNKNSNENDNESKYWFGVISDEIKQTWFEAIDLLIPEVITSATPITLNELSRLSPNDGDNFVVLIKKKKKISPISLDYKGKRVTVTVRGTGSLGNTVEDISFSGRNGSMFKVGKGVVLILENIALIAKKFTLDCVVQVNGGILVIKRSVIKNQYFTGGSNQNYGPYRGFDSGKRVNGMFCDVLRKNRKGGVYS